MNAVRRIGDRAYRGPLADGAAAIALAAVGLAELLGTDDYTPRREWLFALAITLGAVVAAFVYWQIRRGVKRRKRR